jgi:two-component system CAI-1 autoinducer sensor kinase/phosphatase CqsS
MRDFRRIWIERLEIAARRSAAYSQGHFELLGLLAWLIPAAGVVDYIVAHPTFDTFIVRFSAAILCLPLLLHRRLPSWFLSRMHLYFVSAMAYCFPFTYGFILSMNASTTPAGSELNIFWILQYFIALFLFIQLIVDGRLSTVLWIVASAFALLPAIALPEANLDELERVFVYPVTAYLTALGIGVLTYRKTAIIDVEKTAAASAIGANLAHELRTPLASIGTLAKGASNLLPVLTSAYEKAKAAGLHVDPLRKSQLNTLNETLSSIRNEVEYSNTIIDMLLLNTADKPITNVDTDLTLVSGVIEESLERFPFNNQKERELVHSELASDFIIEAPRILLVHVLFNLVKNALYFVQKSGKGSITISAYRDKFGGRIAVHDTGAGIPPSIQPHIFERFYTTTTTGQSAGIGLSFCKLVMESIGGKISCESKEGEYTTFTLTFPNIRVETPSPHSGSTLQTPLAD